MFTARSPPAPAADGGQAGGLIYIKYLLGKESGHHAYLFLSLKYLMYKWSMQIFHKVMQKNMRNNFKSKLQRNNWYERSRRRLGMILCDEKEKQMREGRSVGGDSKRKIQVPFLLAKSKWILHVVNGLSFEFSWFCSTRQDAKRVKVLRAMTLYTEPSLVAILQLLSIYTYLSQSFML